MWSPFLFACIFYAQKGGQSEATKRNARDDFSEKARCKLKVLRLHWSFEHTYQVPDSVTPAALGGAACLAP